MIKVTPNADISFLFVCFREQRSAAAASVAHVFVPRFTKAVITYIHEENYNSKPGVAISQRTRIHRCKDVKKQG